MSQKLVACAAADVPRGSIYEASVSEGSKIIIVHTTTDRWFATGNKCTHYGASLAKGVLCGERLTCPWHGSAFNLNNGDIEEAPALDALMTFPVQVVGKDVVVTLPNPLPKNWKRDPTMAPFGSAGGVSKRVLLIGGGPASAACAEKLRQLGFGGSIVLVTGEKHLPYDRPKLSKALSSKADAIALRPPEFYTANKIEVLVGHRVKDFDPSAKYAILNDDRSTRLDFDYALIATGGDARMIPCEGHKLANIFPLRNPEDSLAVNAAADTCTSAVIVGSSFIGMEVAACLKQAKKIDKVTVVGMEKVAFERVLGPAVGQALQHIHEKKGVDFRMERTVAKFEGDKNGRVSAVILNNGERLAADLVVIGAGVIPATTFLTKNIKLDRDNSVLCDKYLRAEGHDAIFAAGDVAKFHNATSDEIMRIEHWDVAMQHGRTVATTIATGTPTPYLSVPVFWTQSFGTSLRYAGHNHNFDDVIVKGNIFEGKFACFYCRQTQVLAVAALNVDPVAAAVAELLRRKMMPTKTQLEGLSLDDIAKM